MVFQKLGRWGVRPGYRPLVITDGDLVREGAALRERFGAERADEFGHALPGLVTDLTSRWQVRPQQLYPSGATSVVLAVAGVSGAPAVLKVSPDAAFLARQVDMLHHLAPTGRVPVVLEQDGGAGAVLLERVLPGDTLDSTTGTLPTPQEWATVLRDLHSTTSAGVDDRLSDRCADMFARIGARQAMARVRPHVPDRVWQQAVQGCRELLAGGQEQVVIHGDLHLGNVLHGGDRGLVVIDPKLCLGDRCFDMVDFVVASGTPADMATQARRLSVLAEMDPERLLAWSGVNAVVTAISRIAWSGPSSRTDALLAFAAKV